jgi:hypothetical protein
VDLYLVADLSTTLMGILNTIYTFGLVAIGLGAVIFVHELGHFFWGYSKYQVRSSSFVGVKRNMELAPSRWAVM